MSAINHRTLPTLLAAIRAATTPTGIIEMFGGATAPKGWLLCDGSAVSRTTYASLFAVLGTTYGVGDGSTTFNLPTFANKFARGNTPGTGAGADTHTHPLSDTNAQGQLRINSADAAIDANMVTSGSWTTNFRAFGASTTSASTVSRTTAIGLMGATDSASNVPAYTGVQFIIKA